MGGSCSSNGLGSGRENFENRCSRRLRRSNSSSSSSSSSSSALKAAIDSSKCGPVAPQRDRKAVPAAAAAARVPAEAVAKPTTDETAPPKTNALKGRPPEEAAAAETEEVDSKQIRQAQHESSNTEDATKPTSRDNTNNIGQDERRARLEKLKEGVDFIETEEDAEAVESAVVKIQSTFRGKKIRSKLGAKQATAAPTLPVKQEGGKQGESANEKEKEKEEKKPPNSRTQSQEVKETADRVAGMQVNDNSGDKEESSKQIGANMPNLPEEEAQRAATKIQAGFKGYKTRKELEGKLSQPLAGQANQQNQGAADPTPEEP